MITAFVPVRGGSKSIISKNIKFLAGMPLVYWVVSALQHTATIDKIVVATDSEEIEQVVLDFALSKVEVYQRDAINAEDTSSTESVVLEYFDKKTLEDEDLFILVQATSPFTTNTHFEQAIDLLINSGKDSLLSCVKNKRFFWNKKGFPINYDVYERPRRQEFEGNMMENGAFYINKVKNIKKYKNRLSGDIAIYEMPTYTSLEIDEAEDWVIAEALMKFRTNNNIIENKDIKLFITDVDGTLTDAGMYYANDGQELKKFNTRDGKAFEILRSLGIKTGIITSEDTVIVKNRAKKLKVDFLYQGLEYVGKLEAVQQLCQKLKISKEQVAYIGDDINCRELLEYVGYAGCPSDAVAAIKAIPNINIMDSKGGEGAVREFVEKIIIVDEVV